MKNWDSKNKIIAVIQANTAQDLEAEVYNAAQIIEENNQPTIYKNNRNCCICGKVATNYHKSIMGQIIFNVCEKHYLATRPGIGFCNKLKSSRMGLLDRKGSFVDLKYWERGSE